MTKSVDFEKRKIIHYGGIHLYPSEIHLLLLLYENPGNGVMDIAENLNVTKGAVSQNLIRLEKKGVLKRGKNKEGRHKVEVVFTETGREILAQCIETRNRIIEKFAQLINSHTDEEKKVILNFLRSSNEILEINRNP